MSSKVERLLPRREPDYTVSVWHRSDGKTTGAIIGDREQPDVLEIADDLISIANGLIDSAGYEAPWYQGMLDERWYVLGGFVFGSAVTGAILACVL